MKRRLMEMLCCPACRGELKLEVFESPGGDPAEIMEGRLACTCGDSYPIVGGVPRMLRGRLLSECLHHYHRGFLSRHGARFPAVPLPSAGHDRKVATMHAFGYQWTTFVSNFQYYKDMFLSFIRPFLAEEDFKDRLVLDVGCGSGRPASIACSFGAEVVAVDLSEAVQTAFEQSRNYPKLHVVQADIYALPFRPRFDFVFSVGVLQHLPSPADALKSIARVVPADRRLVLWVYGKREWWYQPIEWLRQLTVRLPNGIVHGLSVLLAVLSEIFLLVPYRILSRLPWTRRLAETIPGRIYARFPFRENVIGWFDRLIAPITFYFSKSDVETMLQSAGFRDIAMYARPDASASWVVQAVKTSEPVAVISAGPRAGPP